MERFILCARSIKKGAFTSEPGKTSFLIVPDNAGPGPEHAVKKEIWIKELRKAAVWGDSANPGRGDILVFIHGYNNDQKVMMKRHEQLQKDLTGAGYKGAVMSFDWPSNDIGINYLEDRHDAKITAMQLVTDGISALSSEQVPGCRINIHLLGHSTGAYVIREAFDDADDANLTNSSWMVSQIVFIGADVSSASMSRDNSSSDSLYRHCARLTNYSNLSDSVLKLSNVKRMGTAPRVGRIGLPQDKPMKAVNVDCSGYFHSLETVDAVRKADQTAVIGSFCHSWHIGNRRFTGDLLETLKGDVDESAFPGRIGADGFYQLKK